MNHDLNKPSKAFLNELQFAFEKNFEALEGWKVAHDELRKKISDLDDEIFKEKVDFYSEGQWSDNANHYYAQYLQRSKWYLDKLKRLNSDEGKGLEIRIVLARYGATEAALSTIAGSILQLAKQTLSFRFGTKPRLVDSRHIGDQDIVEVIWEGRNHALHWEDPRTKGPVKNLLRKLGELIGVEMDVKKNNALIILDILGWASFSNVKTDLESLLELEHIPDKDEAGKQTKRSGQ